MRPSVAEMFGGTFEQQMAVVHGLGITGPVAERLAAGFDAELGRALLSLLRSARQPVMAEAGKGLARARQRPGLALIPTGTRTQPWSVIGGQPNTPALRSLFFRELGTSGPSRTLARLPGR